MTSDVVFLDRIRVKARIGTTEQERDYPQEVTISIRLYVGLSVPGETDRLDQTVDYGQVERGIRELAERTRFNLVEALAESVAHQALKHSVEAVWVRVEKTPFNSTGPVGVEIWRGKS